MTKILEISSEMLNLSIKILEIFNEILEISTDMFDTIFTLDFSTKTLNKIKKCIQKLVLLM